MMIPIHETETTNYQSGNYSGEAKTESLVLCSKLNGLHQQKSPQSKSFPSSERRQVLASNRVFALRNSERAHSARNIRSAMIEKAPLPTRLTFPNLISTCPSGLPCQTKLVKVSVYTKAVNPYIVIYDSNRKYAKPSAYLKLMNCTVEAGCEKGREVDDDNNNDEDSCMFRIISSKLEDADGIEVISLRASNVEKRDEWVDFLNDVCKGTQGKSTTGYVPGSSVLPTLVEQEDNENEDEPNKPVDSLKSPSRRKNREGRRSSLNSIGIRLRCYTLGKNR